MGFSVGDGLRDYWTCTVAGMRDFEFISCLSFALLALYRIRMDYSLRDCLGDILEFCSIVDPGHMVSD